MLVVRVAGENDVVGVDVVFSGSGDAASARAGKLRGEQISRPKCDSCVDETEKHRGTDEAQTRHEENWKKERGAERAEVVKREDVGDHIAKFVAVAHDAHEQRDFETNENAHNDDEGVKN